jgi:hypothetical protein
MQIGDGKLPNKYWVSIFEDYYYYNKDIHGYDWMSEKLIDFKGKGKTYKPFNTYKEAKEFFNSLYINDIKDNILIKGKTIEDRITGQLCEEIYVEEEICPCCKHKTEKDNLYNEDLKFTKNEMSKRGYIFE